MSDITDIAISMVIGKHDVAVLVYCSIKFEIFQMKCNARYWFFVSKMCICYIYVCLTLIKPPAVVYTRL